MSLMLRLSSIIILSSVLNANEAKVLEFLQKNINSNDKYEVKNIKIKNSKKLDKIKGFRVYYAIVQVHLKAEKKDINFTEVVFSNGEYFVQDFIHLQDQTSIKNSLMPKIDIPIYRKSHIVAGNENAKHKLVVFSDPLCEFCMSFIPFIIDTAKQYPNDFMLYYYDLPLNKNSYNLIKAYLAAEKKGLKDAVYKMYKAKFNSKNFNEDEFLKLFNKKFKLDLDLNDINEEWILEKIKDDIMLSNMLLINTTPTLFVDGVKDTKKDIFKALYEKVTKQ